MNRILATAIAGLLALPVYAEGDTEAGKKAFNKCKSCHLIADPDGEVIVKGGKTGPNLYGVAGRTAGTVEGFKYGDSIVEAGENGLVWDEATFVEYAQDPKAFLQSYLDQTSAKSKMTFKLKKGAEDVYAYIVSVSGE
ncbi:c-type cytochrome [Ruegeria faecimaris]|uniref:Cytochrome c n=1 Tax=Ruegeria faecimaris TaxID=686389 RepID=A0A521EAM2_9RHOB|nr:cytochrome C [Ruegeria faecimaris]SMO80969.1 cytochrome c [Ruegeria faecimaris]